MARDHVQHLGHHHRQLRLVVALLEQLARLARGEEEAEVLVVVAVHGHPRVVEQRAEQERDLGVVGLQPVVVDDRRLDAVLRELAQELEGDVGDDLDVHPGVVVDLQARDRVDVGDVPERLQLGVGVHALDDGAELPVAPRRHADPHLLDRLRRRHARFALELGGRRRLVDDQLFRLLLIGHGHSVRA